MSEFESKSRIYTHDFPIVSSKCIRNKKGKANIIVVNNQKYIREMDSCLVDCIAYSARAVQVFHGNDYEHWQTGKCFHSHTYPFTTSPIPLHPILPLILFDRGFPIFFFFLIKGTTDLNTHVKYFF